jgi:hypothetical protein
MTLLIWVDRPLATACNCSNLCPMSAILLAVWCGGRLHCGQWRERSPRPSFPPWWKSCCHQRRHFRAFSGTFFCFLLSFFLGVSVLSSSTLLETESSEAVERFAFLSFSCCCISSQEPGGMVRCVRSSKVACRSGSVIPSPRWATAGGWKAEVPGV